MPSHKTALKLVEELLTLHKILLDFQKAEFEQKFGFLSSPAAYFNAVTSHTAFAWLRQLSKLIVRLEELLEKTPFVEEEYKNFTFEIKNLLISGEIKNTFQENYIVALRKEPMAALAHGKVIQLLNYS